MKKIFALLLCMAMLCTLLAGCGDEDSKEDAEKKAESAASKLAEEIEDLDFTNEEDMDEVTGALADYAGALEDTEYEGVDDLQTYVDTLKNDDSFESTQQTFLSQGLEYDIVARGDDTLLYQYTFIVEVDEDTFVDQVDLDAIDSMMESALPALQMEAPCIECVVFEYCNMDGEVLISREYR